MRLRAALMACAVMASGCGVVGGDPDEAGGGGLVSSALADLPLIGNEGRFEVRVIDFAAAGELLGLDAPAGDRLPTVALPAPRAGGGLGFMVAMPETLRFAVDDESFRASAGFSLDDIDSMAEVSALPHQASVVTGPAGWGGETQPLDDQVSTIGTGEDLAVDPANRSSMDTLGRPVRVADADGVLVSSLSTPVVRGWVDGSGERLDSDARLVAIASALDRHEVVAATLFRGYDFSTPLPIASLEESADEFADRAEEALQADGISRPFIDLGVGNTVRDGRAIEVVAYHFINDEAAEAALPSVERAWTESTVDSIGEPVTAVAEFDSIERSGAVVTVVVIVPDDRVGAVLRMVFSRDRPTTHR